MKIDISKIRAGDEVQIGGAIWERVDEDMRVTSNYSNGFAARLPLCYYNITAHRPAQPEPQPFEWLSEDEWEGCLCYQQTSDPDAHAKPEVFQCWETFDKVIQLLTAKYPHGPLVVKTATGEEEGQYDVFWLDHRICCLECDLEPGDRYIDIPDLSKEGES
jgi:hypothetical protein